MPHFGPYHHGNLKASLLRAAIELIGETGPGGFNLREVARRAGVSHNAPYRHFRNKEDLLAEVSGEGFAELNAALLEGVDSEGSALARLKRAGYSYVAFALRRPEHFAAMFDSAVLDPPSLPTNESAFATLVGVIDLCQREGQLPDGGTAYRALLAWSLMHGIAKLAVSRRLPFRSPDEILQFSVSALDALITSLRLPLDSAMQARAARKTPGLSGAAMPNPA